MPITCDQCYSPNPEIARFCHNCGSAIWLTGNVVQTPAPSYSSGAIPPSLFNPTPSGGFAVGMASASLNYALWTDRVVGYLIDSLFVVVGVVVFYFVVTVVFGVFAGVGGALGSAGAEDAGATATLMSAGGCCIAFVLFPVVTLLVGLYNKIYLVSKRGASIGQGIMKLKVVNERGELLSMGATSLRLLAQIGIGLVPFVGSLLDLLWPLWDEKRQTLHDKAVNSLVIKRA